MKVLVINASANKERSTTLKLTKTFLAKVRQAGAEYKETERISDDTQTYLDTPMLPAEAFVKTANGIFEGMLKK